MDEKIIKEETDISEPKQQIFDDDDTIEIKPIEQEREDDGYGLADGEALDERRLYQLASRRKIHFVYILGPAGSGKTTLETMLYGTFTKYIDNNILFAGSETLIGFEKRLWNARAESGYSEVQMERTLKGERKLFLHLDLLDRKKEQHCNLIFSDISGETFEECCSNCFNLERELPYLDFARNIVLFIDGERLLDKAQRQACVSKVKSFLRTFISSKYYDPGINVDIVVSKNDKIYQNTDQNIKEFIDHIMQNFNFFNDKLVLDFFRIESINGTNLADPKTSTDLFTMLMHWMNSKRKVKVDELYSEKRKLKNECNRFGEGY